MQTNFFFAETCYYDNNDFSLNFSKFRCTTFFKTGLIFVFKA
jgi:hypothetical protein